MQLEGNVIVCDTIDEKGLGILKNAGLHVEYLPEITNQDLISRAKDYDVIIVRSRTKITKDVIVSAVKAKIIARVGVGLDNIDVNEAQKRGIEVINAGEASVTAVSELVLGFMFSLSRNIPIANNATKNGKWIKKDLMGGELKGKYLGIIGLGKIGRNVARLARGLRMNLIGYDVVPIDNSFTQEVSLITTDLKTLLESSDFVTCHVPFTEQTKHLINKDMLSKMKKNAFLINTSRGEVIDEQALIECLKNKRIGGAALDVYEVEPPTNKELLELDNIICTPHIAAQTREGQELASMVIGEKIVQKLLEKQIDN
ncbi:MAG: D-2-hydroxyacid dehydrogenase [Candidatus Nitrosocosmicus sp.]|jgi:D-3-phosphoglycerate dehydrogenase|uniref:D-2-hydroxyacid dehydrogenase n=1 Tax=Candidatus Nitrosocosmicus agrestis TaxID=2563600 RepID=UPI00122E5EAA|nr:D-2-hydroxyacid dehydrogenase [Candidatus Nitrosocosmicus sp. SS]KAA2283064.1 3-phosphoglycerate dehydrogenase [Candidatus Nitrosocosmicus sp. SS]KAF0868523.1 3-phosphoglycerate dehydrogenase [Candidatus Nitrosocosmicus sp. SS]MDR4490088.1 D-2-hydroxyacid dehydrogenase [Candidatus Nitrosocosmicus sp.]HET8793544.1 D-2-hydroxyacid dehydrogenase [Nitrososphaeraceae archaeon]